MAEETTTKTTTNLVEHEVNCDHCKEYRASIVEQKNWRGITLHPNTRLGKLNIVMPNNPIKSEIK